MENFEYVLANCAELVGLDDEEVADRSSVDERMQHEVGDSLDCVAVQIKVGGAADPDEEQYSSNEHS
jgi:hypothetical protein